MLLTRLPRQACPPRASLRIRTCRRCFASNLVSTREPFRVLFCGSDDFSVGSLKAVLEAKDVWQSIHVITPPVQNIGRGGPKAKKAAQVYKPALLGFAEEHDLTRSTTTSLLGDAKVPASQAWSAPAPFDEYHPSNLLLTASFGYIIPNTFLNQFDPAHRLNVHPSLLPRWRGAAPIQWTIANGDETTGVSVQRLVERGKGIDAGDIVGLRPDIAVPERATFHSFLPQLADIGGEVLVDTLRNMLAGQTTATPQDPSSITRAPKISKETARIDWERHSAMQLDRLHRGAGHQHSLWTEHNGVPLQLVDPVIVTSPSQANVPAALQVGQGYLDKSSGSPRFLIACRALDEESRVPSWLEVRTVKPHGKRQMDVKEWWNGFKKLERSKDRVQLGQADSE